MIVLNGIVFIAELVTGFITHSLSLQSDAWHMLSDQAALCIGLIAHRMSKRPPSPSMTFGYARTEVLRSLINAIFLLAVCLTIFFDAIELFIDAPTIEQPLLFLVVGTIGMVTNMIGLFLFHEHGDSDNIRGVFLHILADFVGSVGVIATALLYYFADWEPKKYAGPVFSILNVFLIVADRCPDSVNSDEIAAALQKMEGVLRVHELRNWELSKECIVVNSALGCRLEGP
jgi:cobalt-zinc-cadmium efflux system protein